MHARQAQKQLGATIPWLVDAMDNRLKHALGDRPNSDFIIDPEGKIVRKRDWSYPAEVRKDLEKLVGKVKRITKEEDIKLTLELPPKSPAPRGIVKRIERPRMSAIAMEPLVDPKGLPFYAKLRAEADSDLLTSGKGKVYLGFHLDPFHEAHWNNLTEPLRYQIEAPVGVHINKRDGQSPKVKPTSDADPREFLLEVEAWPEDKPIVLTVTYSACVGEKTCHAVQQRYVLNRKRDRDGGGARGEGAGFWKPEELGKMLLVRDPKGDGKITRETVIGLIVPHFEHFDKNKDGVLDAEEAKVVADWLNKHHQPGQPRK